MEEKRIRRGEVWFVRRDNAVGHEISTPRPAVVLSSRDTVMDYPLVVVAFMTTTPKEDLGVAVKLTTPHRDSWVLCHQLFSIDESRLLSIMCKLSDKEMAAIDEALGEVLNVPIANKSERQKIYELEKEIESQKIRIATLEKLYERSLDQYVDLRLKVDADARLTPKKVEVVEPTKEKVIEKPKSVKPVKKKKPEPVVVTGEQVKVNVNTCTWKELVEKTGICESTAKEIVRYRKKYEQFLSLEDLLIVPRFGKTCMKRYGSMLEV